MASRAESRHAQPPPATGRQTSNKLRRKERPAYKPSVAWGSLSKWSPSKRVARERQMSWFHKQGIQTDSIGLINGKTTRDGQAPPAERRHATRRSSNALIV